MFPSGLPGGFVELQESGGGKERETGKIPVQDDSEVLAWATGRMDSLFAEAGR